MKSYSGTCTVVVDGTKVLEYGFFHSDNILQQAQGVIDELRRYDFRVEPPSIFRICIIPHLVQSESTEIERMSRFRSLVRMVNGWLKK
jgi:hypothetical protein